MVNYQFCQSLSRREVEESRQTCKFFLGLPKKMRKFQILTLFKATKQFFSSYF